MSNVYVENGYENRKDYLKCMAEDYGVPYGDVVQFAQVMGADEDFDGLITMLEDYSEMFSEMEDEKK